MQSRHQNFPSPGKDNGAAIPPLTPTFNRERKHANVTIT